ncbi:MAG: ABC transporter ATP-binding protein [Proteobacteria bacterium]|nr:ABC transporter ATP-binding protein [Pseudomonadota bacterium]NDD04914.1 ABC transporter ATP-binding protein [Pseudomonadota bacterium]
MNSSMNNVDILIKNVSKRFSTGWGKSKMGVDGLSLEVPKGQVVGLLGPNGSGKSTTIKMILGFLKPTAGEIWVCGHQVPDKITRSFIGYLPENPRFPKFLSGRALLTFYGNLLSLSGKALTNRIDFLLDLVDLRWASEEKVQGYSKGMTQRLAIAQSLLNEPRLLIFDEPMSGLDPLGRKDIRNLIRRIHSELPEATIFFSSHILEDVEQLCSSVALLRKGKLKTFCSIDELLKVEGNRFEVSIRDSQQADTLPPGNLTTKNLNGTEELISFLNQAQQKGISIASISSHRNKLEEALFKEGELNLNHPENNQPEARQ